MFTKVSKNIHSCSKNVFSCHKKYLKMPSVVQKCPGGPKLGLNYPKSIHSSPKTTRKPGTVYNSFKNSSLIDKLILFPLPYILFFWQTRGQKVGAAAVSWTCHHSTKNSNLMNQSLLSFLLLFKSSILCQYTFYRSVFCLLYIRTSWSGLSGTNNKTDKAAKSIHTAMHYNKVEKIIMTTNNKKKQYKQKSLLSAFFK